LRSELYFKEQSECLFRPQLIAKRQTDKLDGKRRLYNDAGEEQPSRFSDLYQQAKKRQEQRGAAVALRDENCTFQPDTSRTRQRNEELIRNAA
jgi:hypothetical protein